MKSYKFSALVRLDPPGDGPDPGLPKNGGRVVLRAEHHGTHHSKMFSALLTAPESEPLRAGQYGVRSVVTVLGDDACDYLEAGDTFVLWRGHDIGQGVISRRLSFWAESP